MTKRIALELFGHLRTFRKTFSSLKKYVIDANEAAGYQVDVFIHTWDQTDHSDVAWHNKTGEDRGVAVTEDDIKFIHDNYRPRALLIEPAMTDGRGHSARAVNKLREDYANERSVRYDLVVQTRPDIQFLSPFLPNDYVQNYRTNLPWTDGYKTSLFTASNIFRNLLVSDAFFPCESDLVWFGLPENMCSTRELVAFPKISIKYRLGIDFKILRSWKKESFFKHMRIALLHLFPYFLVAKEIERLKRK